MLTFSLSLSLSFTKIADQRFINKVFGKISHLQKRIEKCQANLDAIKQSINAWGKVPLFQRKDLNPKALLGVEPRADIIAKRVKQANNTKELIDKLMYENAKLFFDIPQRYVIDESSEAFEEEDDEERPTPNIAALSAAATAAEKAVPEAKRFTQQTNDGIEEASSEGEVCKYILLYSTIVFEIVIPLIFLQIITPQHRYDLLQTLTETEREQFREYEKYVDTQIASELLDAVITSITYLRMEIDNRYENDAPIFEILMELQEPLVVYFLNLDPSSPYGFTIHIDTLIDDMYNMMSMLPRVAQDPPQEGEEPDNFMGMLGYFS